MAKFVNVINSDWCDSVRVRLIEKHLSQRELAEILGCNETYLSAIINGKKISPKMGSAISDYLNIENNYLKDTHRGLESSISDD